MKKKYEVDKRRLVFLFICLLGFLTYGNCLQNGFVGDDQLLIVHNTFYRSLSNIPRLFQQGYSFEMERDLLQSFNDHGSGSVSYRPFDNLTYFLDYQLWGLNPLGYHLTNLIIHIGNMLLLYALCLRWQLAPAVAFLGALLFGLHPIQSEAVAVVGYRADSLAAFFVLLSFYAWMRWGNARAKGWYGLSLAAYFLALFTKESVALYPLVLWVYGSLNGQGAPQGRWRAQLPYWFLTAFYLYVYFFVFPNSALPNNHLPVAGLFQYVVLLGKMWSQYLLWFLLPWTVRPVPPLYAPPLEGAHDLAVIALTLLAMGWVAYAYGRRKKILLFLLSWFLLFYAPVSNVIPLANPLALRFMYLPSVGLCLAAAVLIEEACALPWMLALSQRIGMILKTALVCLCMILTFVLNRYWHDHYLIASMWTKYYPASWKARFVLGQLTAAKGDYPKARAYFAQSAALGARQHDVRVDYFLGLCYLSEKNFDRAIVHFKRAIAGYGDYADAAYALAETYREKKDYAKAEEYFKDVIDAFPSRGEYYMYPTALYFELNQPDKARALLAQARQKVSAEEMKELDVVFANYK